MFKRILLPISHGSEELEAVAILDICRRAGIHVHLAKVGPHKAHDHATPIQCVMFRGLVMSAENHIEDYKDLRYDCIVLPGGMQGAQAFF